MPRSLARFSGNCPTRVTDLEPSTKTHFADELAVSNTHTVAGAGRAIPLRQPSPPIVAAPTGPLHHRPVFADIRCRADACHDPGTGLVRDHPVKRFGAREKFVVTAVEIDKREERRGRGRLSSRYLRDTAVQFRRHRRRFAERIVEPAVRATDRGRGGPRVTNSSSFRPARRAGDDHPQDGGPPRTTMRRCGPRNNSGITR